MSHRQVALTTGSIGGVPSGIINVLSYGAKGDAVDGSDLYIDTPAGQFLNQDEQVTIPDGGGHTKTIGVNKGVVVPGVDAQWVVNDGMTTAQTAAALKTAVDSVIDPVGFPVLCVLDVNRTGGIIGATDRVWVRSPFYADAASSDTIANGAFVITDLKKGSIWSGTDDTAAFNAAWAALVARGGGTLWIPSILPDGTKARYRIAGGVSFTLTSGGSARDVTALIDGDWSLIILDGGGIQTTVPGNFDIGGELARCEVQDLTIRGRSYWSEDGKWAVRFSGFGAAATYRFGPVRFIGWMDGPGNGAIWSGLDQVSPGSALYAIGFLHAQEVEFFGCGARRYDFSAHQIQKIVLADCFAYDSGILEGINYEKTGANSLGWFGLANALNGTNGFDWGIVEVRNLTHDENYCFAPAGAVTGGVSFDPGLIAPGEVAPFNAAARYGSILCEQIHGKIAINSGGFGAGVLIRQGDANTLFGLYDFRPAGLSQNILALEDNTDTFLRAGKGTTGATGDGVIFIGTGNVTYREEGCVHAAWRLFAGATLPAIAEVERNGITSRLVLTGGAVTAKMLAAPDTGTNGRFIQVPSAGVFGSALPLNVPTVCGVFLDDASGANGVVRLVEKAGQRVTVIKDTRVITRGQLLGASPGIVAVGMTGGQVRPCLHGGCLRALESSSAAVGSDVLAEWLGATGPTDLQHWMWNATGGSVAVGYVGKLQAGALATADYLVPTVAVDDPAPKVVVVNAVAGDDVCEVAQADDIVPVTFDAGAANPGDTVTGAAVAGQAHVPLVAALTFKNIIGVMRDVYAGGAAGTNFRVEIGGSP